MHVSKAVEIVLIVLTVGMFLGTLVGIPIFLVRIPNDYFSRQKKRSTLVSVIRTVAGILVVGLGVAMLVLPGQGLLTVLVGLAMMDLPFKKRLIRKILSNEKVSSTITKLRRKHGRGPLELPGGDEPVPSYA
jgi:hypothetical protein